MAILLGHATGSREVTPSAGEPLLLRATPDLTPDQVLDHVIQVQDSHDKLYQLGYTPVNVKNLVYYLDLYPIREDALLLREGFTNGFRLQFAGKTLTSSVKNLNSANLQLNSLKEIIAKEVEAGRMVGPFNKPPFVNLQVSPVGLVPKTDGRWRLISFIISGW